MTEFEFYTGLIVLLICGIAACCFLWLAVKEWLVVYGWRK